MRYFTPLGKGYLRIKSEWIQAFADDVCAYDVNIQKYLKYMEKI